MLRDDLDKPLDDHKTVPTWDHPHSSVRADDKDEDPSAPRVIIELWSGQPQKPVCVVGDVEVVDVYNHPSPFTRSNQADLPSLSDQSAPPDLGGLDDPDKTLDLPPDHPDNWQAPTPTRSAHERGPYPYAKTTSPLTRPSGPATRGT